MWPQGKKHALAPYPQHAIGTGNGKFRQLIKNASCDQGFETIGGWNVPATIPSTVPDASKLWPTQWISYTTYAIPRIAPYFWLGAKYAIDSKTDITGAWYHQLQNDFRVPSTCAPGNFRASCAGALNEFSLYSDHRFTKRLDAYVGVAYSNVTGGLAIAIPHGPGVPYFYDNNVAPTLGVRFAF